MNQEQIVSEAHRLAAAAITHHAYLLKQAARDGVFPSVLGQYEAHEADAIVLRMDELADALVEPKLDRELFARMLFDTAEFVEAELGDESVEEDFSLTFDDQTIRTRKFYLRLAEEVIRMVQEQGREGVKAAG